MSGQGWETVGKSNKKVNVPAKKLTKAEKQKFVDNSPKIGDIMPLNIMHALYEKEPQAPVAVEKPVPKPKKKVAEKKNGVVKTVAVPKTLEIAAKLLDLNEVVALVELDQTRFPDEPLLWLKNLAQLLNTRLNYSASSAQPHATDSFLSALPAPLRNQLHKSVERTGANVQRQFFHYAVLSMANGMRKGTSVIGFKILIQVVAAQSASKIMADQDKLTLLRQSYLNTPAIGLSIFWAQGQVGIKDISLGLKIWQEQMAPELRMKNYSSFLIGYLKLVSSLSMQSGPVSPSQLVEIMNIASAVNVAGKQQELTDVVSVLLKRSLEVEPEKRAYLYFGDFLQVLGSDAGTLFSKVLLPLLTSCLKLDSRCFDVWQKLNAIFEKNKSDNVIRPTTLLLEYISIKEWENFNPKRLREALSWIELANKEHLAGKSLKSPNMAWVQRGQAAIEVIRKKMTTTRSFPWRFWSFILLIALVGAVSFDVQKHGSFKASSTGLFLRDVGALKYGEQAWASSKTYYNRGYAWTAENVPVYYKQASERAGPYLVQAKETAIVIGSHVNQTCWNAYAYAKEKAPIVEAWVNHYAPGLIPSVQTGSVKAWALTKEYAWFAGNFVWKQSVNAADWAKTNIFVGNLSPEKLQQYSQEAFNTTQVYAAWTYDWVLEKVHTLSKVR